MYCSCRWQHLSDCITTKTFHVLVHSRVKSLYDRSKIERVTKVKEKKQSSFVFAQVTMDSDFIPTRCARLAPNVVNNFVSVKYEAHKKKVKDASSAEIDGKLSSKDRISDRLTNETDVDPRKQQEAEMKRARYDVIKFGMSGLQGVESHRAKIASAVALGARPPKNRRINYKRLKELKSKTRETSQRKNEAVSGVSGSLKTYKFNKNKSKQRSSGASWSNPAANKEHISALNKSGKVKKNQHKSKDSGILGIYGTVKKTAFKRK